MLGPPLSHVPSSLQFMLHCMGLLLAQSGHPGALNQCLLLGVKRTRRRPAPKSALGQKRTSAVHFRRISYQATQSTDPKIA